MKTETRVLLGVTLFFVVIGAAYAVVSNERAGSVMLAASASMGLLASSSIWMLSRHAPERAEDRDDADPADGAGRIGVFALESVWPFVIGLGATVMMSGFAFGSWLVLTGGGAFVLGLVGFVAESRAGKAPGATPTHSPSSDSSGSSTST